MRQRTCPGPVVGLAGVVALLVVLDLEAAGWAVGLGCGLGLGALLTIGLRRADRLSLLPADRVTLTRAVLVCGVAGLVADRLADPAQSARPAGLLVALTSVALALDAVDGRVARRTGTVHPLGARFDMETDALLILVLGVHVAQQLGPWVLGIGAARYLLLLVALAGRWAPWLRGQVPARRWRKAVAAYQGVALTVVTGGLLPPAGAAGAMVVGLGLLGLSFGTEVWTLRRLALPELAAPEPRLSVRWAGAAPGSLDARALP